MTQLLDRAGRPLDLTPETETIAQDVLDRFGSIVSFVSGRRTRAQQASAMAENVVSIGRDWLRRTYLYSPVETALAHWLETHPEQTSIGEIRAGFLAVMDLASGVALRRLSLHLSGEAFDLSPRTGPDGDAMRAHLQQRRDVKFLDHEGGAVRWHVQRRWMPAGMRSEDGA